MLRSRKLKRRKISGEEVDDFVLKKMDYKLKKEDQRIKEIELTVKKFELEMKKRDRFYIFSNPFIVGVSVAVCGWLGTGVLAYYNNRQSRELERQKAQDSRVLEVIKVGDWEKAKNNLLMLLDTGLYDDPGGKLRAYTQQVPAERGAYLPSASLREVSCTSGSAILQKHLYEKNVKNANVSWLSKAFAEVGVGECDESGKRKILDFLRSINLDASDLDVIIPWSSAFVSWIMASDGKSSTRSGSARSWLNWGSKLDKPKIGAVVVGWRVRKESPFGFVGFVVDILEDDEIVVLGGNIKNQVGFSRIRGEQVLGYRWPS